MSLFGKIKDNVQERFENRPRMTFRELMAGDFLEHEGLIKQFPFLLLIVILSMLIVHNRFEHEAELRQVKDLETELIDVKNTSLNISRELMQMSRQSYVIEKLQEQGSSLQLSCEPAVVIE